MDRQNQPANQSDLRQLMPKVAEIVNEKRTELGKGYVNAMIKRGMAGEPNCFYACEGGRIIGTPFSIDKAFDQFQLSGMALKGAAFVAIQTPSGKLGAGNGKN